LFSIKSANQTSLFIRRYDNTLPYIFFITNVTEYSSPLLSLRKTTQRLFLWR
jgi:hypothetical protein